MTDDQLSDLKQFIDSQISQTEQAIRVDMVNKDDMSTGFNSISQKIDEGFEGIAEAIEQIHQQAETQEAEVDRRFKKLEQQTA
jgi:DNA-binding transcriptional MerR regulator